MEIILDKKTIAYYDSSAQVYLDKTSRKKPDSDLRSFIAATPPGGDVLDFGCGPGNSAAMMRAAGLTVHASDGSLEMVRIAAKYFGINAVHADFNELDDIKKYNSIWANFSLLHAPRSEMPSNLSRIFTALKPSGYLHLGLKIGNGEKRDKLGRNYTFYQPNELSSLLISAGFSLHSQRIDTNGTISMTGALEPFMIVTAYA